MSTFFADIRYGLRMLAKSRQFTLVALTALALGIGANTAIFTVVNSVLIRPLPFRDADRLTIISASRAEQDRTTVPLSLPEFFDVRDESRAFESMSAWALGRFNLSGRGVAEAAGSAPELVQYAVTTANLFSVLGVAPAAGRTFDAADDRAGAPRVVMLSAALWHRYFGSDPSVVGRTVTLDGKDYQVVGVLPAGFRFLSFQHDTDVWLPLGSDPFSDRRYARGVRSMGVIARLKPGATLAQAQVELNTIADRLARAFPGDNRGRALFVLSLRDQTVKNLKPAILVLLGAVGFVLLIACANVANLLLARATSRHREMAIRAALGAGRGRLIRQLLTEHAVLGIVGGGFGLLVATWGIDLLSILPREAPSLFVPYSIGRGDIAIDRVVLGFTVALSLATAFIFGVTPALEGSRLEVTDALKSGGSGSTAGSRRQSRMRASLVVAEVALSVMLLVGAGLLVRTFLRLQQVDPGFRPENVLSFDVNLPPSKYAAPARTEFFQRAIADLRQLGGVAAAGAVEYLPLSGADSSTASAVEGRPQPAPGEEVQAHYRSVTPDYFRAMGIALVRGRAFTDGDRADAPRVALINETMARRLWGGENPIGRRMAITVEALRFRRDGPPTVDMPAAMREVVGIVADVRHVGPRTEPLPEVYMPFAQRPVASMSIVVRTANDPLAVARDARHVVTSIDKDQPIANIASVSELLAESIAQPRFNGLLLSVFAAIAVLLAVVGVYGVMSYSVALRAREIGVRIALGGQARDIASLIVWQGMRVALTGLAIGLVCALALGRVMSGLLFGVRATDPATFAGAGIVLAAVALVACYLPARRAGQIDPMDALRSE